MDGNSGYSPALASAVPALTDEELDTLLQVGQGYMPGFPEFDAQNRLDVIAYLRVTFP